MKELLFLLAIIAIFITLSWRLIYCHNRNLPESNEAGKLIEKSEHHHTYINSTTEEQEDRYFITVKLDEKEIVFEVPQEYYRELQINDKIKMSVTRNFYSNEVKECKLKQHKNIIWNRNEGVIWN